MECTLTNEMLHFNYWKIKTAPKYKLVLYHCPSRTAPLLSHIYSGSKKIKSHKIIDAAALFKYNETSSNFRLHRSSVKTFNE